MRDVIEKTWGWDEGWQRKDFDRRFREYLTSIIECNGRPAGGLMLEWKPESLYIPRDPATTCVPEQRHRNRGNREGNQAGNCPAASGDPLRCTG